MEYDYTINVLVNGDRPDFRLFWIFCGAKIIPPTQTETPVTCGRLILSSTCWAMILIFRKHCNVQMTAASEELQKTTLIRPDLLKNEAILNPFSSFSCLLYNRQPIHPNS